jgi:hypothetical protein
MEITGLISNVFVFEYVPTWYACRGLFLLFTQHSKAPELEQAGWFYSTFYYFMTLRFFARLGEMDNMNSPVLEIQKLLI